MAKIKELENKISLESTIMLLFGFFASMPILAISSITFFTIFLFIVILLNIIKLLKSSITFKINYCFLWIVIFSFITSLICKWGDLASTWKDIQLKRFVFMFAFFFLYSIYSSNQEQGKVKLYLKGLYYGSIVQVIWGYLQIIIYYSFDLSINKLVFNDFFNISVNATQIKDGSIVANGLCWNAGNIAPLVLFGYIFSKNKYVKSAYVLFSFVCGSRTLLVGMVTVLLLQAFFALKNHQIQISKKAVLGMIFIILIGIVFILINSNLVAHLNTKIISMLTSFLKLKDEGSGSVHINYLVSVFEIAKNTGIVNILFGYGLGCSGYPFATFYGQYKELGAYCVECDPINILWSRGIVGFTLFYFMFFKYLYRGYKVDFNYAILGLAIFVQGITYNVMEFYWVSVTWYFIMIMIDHGVLVKDIIGSSKRIDNYNFQ